MSMTQSAIFTGTVRHRRFHPIKHALNYSAFMVWLNLDEADDVLQRSALWGQSRFSLARFRREDYFTLPDLPNSSTADNLKLHVSEAFRRETGIKPEHICMMTNLRYFGYLINPVTFYYAYAADGKHLGILSEITNTPWDERFHYTLLSQQAASHTTDTSADSTEKSRGIKPEHTLQHADGHQRHRYRFNKVFHVSPFNPLDMTYIWSMPEVTDDCLIHMQTMNQGRLDFDATMTMNRQPMTSKTMRRILLHYPFMTMKVVWGIYSNALRLWLKKSPFYDHPENDPEQDHKKSIAPRQEHL
ncbi:MAG TPA: DUF1365 domain-containing protein [Oceanospirillales bacterium]|nr:DUF1365 domain-containing protein [Oceanospirillales bacterium]